MSTKRMLSIVLFGFGVIAVVIAVMLLGSYLNREPDTIALPSVPDASPSPQITASDSLITVEVTPDTVQAVIRTLILQRPLSYTREVMIESYSEYGKAVYNITAAVTNNVTSLRILQSGGIEKRIIVTPDKWFIWYNGDSTPFVRNLNTLSPEPNSADQWQMLISYEDTLAMDNRDIIDAGFTNFGDEPCIYAVYKSPLLGYSTKYYISIKLGLIVGAEEYDESDTLVYNMSAGQCSVGEADASAFTLPDDTSVLK